MPEGRCEKNGRWLMPMRHASCGAARELMSALFAGSVGVEAVRVAREVVTVYSDGATSREVVLLRLAIAISGRRYCG